MCRQMLPEGHIIQQATSLAEMATITDKGTIEFFAVKRQPSRVPRGSQSS